MKHRELVFCRRQYSFLRFMLKFPFIKPIDTGGWIKDPLSKSSVLCGVCDYAAPEIVAHIINIIIWKVLDDDVAKHNRGLCIKYGLITPIEKP